MARDYTDVLLDIYDVAASSFVSYVVEVSKPPVEDDADRDALAVFDRIHSRVDQSCLEVGQTLADLGVHTGDIHWPLAYTTYNFLRPSYLVGPVLERMRLQKERIEDLAREARDGGGLTAEQDALLGTLVEREQSSIADLETALRDIPGPTASAPRLKGTSASRW